LGRPFSRIVGDVVGFVLLRGRCGVARKREE